MGKNKQRKFPDKPQNRKLQWCQYYEEHDGFACCEITLGDVSICKGNPHNCIKTLYHRAASRSNKQINEGVFSKR